MSIRLLTMNLRIKLKYKFHITACIMYTLYAIITIITAVIINQTNYVMDIYILCSTLYLYYNSYNLYLQRLQAKLFLKHVPITDIFTPDDEIYNLDILHALIIILCTYTYLLLMPIPKRVTYTS